MSRVSPSGSPTQWYRHLVARARLDVPVHAVVRRVELAADVPLRERRVVPVEYPVPLRLPGQPLGRPSPRSEAVALGLVVRVGLHVGVRGEVGRRLEPRFSWSRLDRVSWLTTLSSPLGTARRRATGAGPSTLERGRRAPGPGCGAGVCSYSRGPTGSTWPPEGGRRDAGEGRVPGRDRGQRARRTHRAW